jgi:hypothetical protein
MLSPVISRLDVMGREGYFWLQSHFDEGLLSLLDARSRQSLLGAVYAVRCEAALRHCGGWPLADIWFSSRLARY